MSDPILNPGAAHRLPRRFGKKPPRIDPRTLQFRKYLTAALPPLPASQNWGAAVPVVPGWGMDGNDTYGDCTIAAWAHADLLWTANANPPAWQPDVATIESTYFALTGGADTGLDMLTVLKFAQSTGMGGHKIGAFAQIDHWQPRGDEAGDRPRRAGLLRARPPRLHRQRLGHRSPVGPPAAGHHLPAPEPG